MRRFVMVAGNMAIAAAAGFGAYAAFHGHPAYGVATVIAAYFGLVATTGPTERACAV